jgi:glucosylglycerate synthase
VRILYDFAAAYHRTAIARDHVLQALVPLYRGQLFSFLSEHARSTPEEMEADSEGLCLEFERQKPYLIERWKAKS